VRGNYSPDCAPPHRARRVSDELLACVYAIIIIIVITTNP